MRTAIAIVVFAAVSVSVAAQTANMTPDALLQRGIASYRSGQYTSAATDLGAASQALLSQEQMQNYVNTGKFPNLDKLETALVYLTLAESKLGHSDRAREAVLRLTTAERIDATYAQLPLNDDAKEFEAIAAKLVPGFSIPANAQIARANPPATTTATATVAEAAPTGPKPAAPTPAATATTASAAPAPAKPAATTASSKPAATTPKTETARTETARAETPRPSAPATSQAAMLTPTPTLTQTTPTTTTEKVPVQPTIASEKEDRQRIIDQLVAQERAKIEKAADERIAAERAAAQKAADERVAAAQRAADERIASERAAIQRAADERVAQAQKTAQTAAMQSQNRRAFLQSLREADSYAATGKLPDADRIYTSIINTQDAPREIVAEAAVGLYRTGAFSAAAAAFRKLAPYARGEEDLRYYNAVALYESGDYAEAKRELACALPFIEITPDVARYRAKIEQTPSQQAAR